jgi:hypothetical protein
VGGRATFVLCFPLSLFLPFLPFLLLFVLFVLFVLLFLHPCLPQGSWYGLQEWPWWGGDRTLFLRLIYTYMDGLIIAID